MEEEIKYYACFDPTCENDFIKPALFVGRSPEIGVKNGMIVVPENINLEGKNLADWLALNPDRFIHEVMVSDNQAPIRTPYYREGRIIKELILRDNEQWIYKEPELNESLNDSLRMFYHLWKLLEETFLNVEPNQENINVYGMNFRNILMLTCTEVEIHLTRLLRLNGYIKDRLNTRDFVKLKRFMNFDYVVNVMGYDQLKPYEPFDGWNELEPSQSLGWYDAYNKVKHDRINNLQRATLSNCLNAMGALRILLSMRYESKWLTDTYSKNNKLDKIPLTIRYAMLDSNRIKGISYTNSSKHDKIPYFERIEND